MYCFRPQTDEQSEINVVHKLKPTVLNLTRQMDNLQPIQIYKYIQYQFILWTDSPGYTGM